MCYFLAVQNNDYSLGSIDYCFNGDLESIVTPVKVNRLVELLNQANYPTEKVEFLPNGFVNGFDIGYEGPEHRQSKSENLPFTIGIESELWGKLMKEVKLGHVAGPFETIPFENYIQSPIGLVPKAGGDQTSLIFHLSYDFKRDKLKSLNHYTPKSRCTVKYLDLDYAVRAYLDLQDEIIREDQERCSYESPSPSSRWKWNYDKRSHQKKKPVIFAGKSDIKSAFRILGLSRWSWQWLVMKARDPKTREWRYFVDKCLPFGASISCALFQEFSDAICHLIEFRVWEHRRTTNYLDDFLFLARTMARCNMIIQWFLEMCQEIGVPVAMEKTEWATEIIIFLGILLDGRNMILAIPIEKRDAAIGMLRNLIQARKVMVKELQKLCGLLNFIGWAVFPGCTFMRRMYSKYSEVVNFGGSPKNTNEYKLKQHHHVRLDQEFKLDCKIWLEFLTDDDELQSVINRPMVDVLGNLATSTDIKFYSDASASKNGVVSELSSTQGGSAETGKSHS